MLSKLVAWAFTSLFEVILWLVVIGCAIAGHVIGEYAGWDVGWFWGAIVGFICCVIFGGAFAIFVNMTREVSEIKEFVAALALESPGFKKMVDSEIEKIVNSEVEKHVEKTPSRRSAADDDNVADFEIVKADNVCKNCGKPVGGDMDFCENCGNRLR